MPVASLLITNDNFKIRQLCAVPSVPPSCHFSVAKVFYDGTIILWKKIVFCSGLLSMAHQREALVQWEIRAREVVDKDHGVAWNSYRAEAEPPLPFRLPHRAHIVCIYSRLLPTACHETEADCFQPFTKPQLFWYNAVSFSWRTKPVKHMTGR